MSDLWSYLLVPIGLGLLGFIEPCSVGASVVFVKYLSGKRRAAKLLETAVFTATRALFLGGLGAVVGATGSALAGWQRGSWLILGVGFVLVGALYLSNRQGVLMRALGPRLERARGVRSAAGLGLLFGFTIPACAAPLLAAVLAMSLGLGSTLRGALLMALFGLALSAPLMALVLWPGAERWLDRLAAVSARVPRWTGGVFLVLGFWSLYLALQP